MCETRVTKQGSLLNNFNLNNCSYELTRTKTSASDTLLYITKNPANPRNVLMT